MGFEVTAGELRAHAGKVDNYAEQVEQAVDAANQAMPDDAYGIICQFLPSVINGLEQDAADALKASHGGLGAISENLRASADSYETQDTEAGLKFSGITGPR